MIYNKKPKEMRGNFRAEGAEIRDKYASQLWQSGFAVSPVHQCHTAELPVVICPMKINDLGRTEEISWV